MANYTYNGIELPALPASNSPVAVISAVLDSASSMFAGASYIVTFGASILWSGSKCYVSNISGVYRYNGSEWVWHYGSGTTYNQDIIASGYFEAVWTNTNIPTADGVSVYLAATDPIPVGGESGGGSEGDDKPPAPEHTAKDIIEARRRGFIAGFLAGINIRGVLSKKTITETADYYLYNGVKLPKLPVFREGHENAVITCNSSGYYLLYSFTFEAYISGNKFLEREAGVLDAYEIENGEWVGWRTWHPDGDATLSWLNPSNIIWANHDLLNEDGTLYLSASEPIPILSNEPIRYEGDIPVYEQKE